MERTAVSGRIREKWERSASVMELSPEKVFADELTQRLARHDLLSWLAAMREKAMGDAKVGIVSTFTHTQCYATVDQKFRRGPT